RPSRNSAGRAGPGSPEGPRRARPAGLRAASATLSQLSYGPVARKSSAEFVVPGPMDPRALIVPCRLEPEEDLCRSREQLGREEIALPGLRAVARDGVDLVTGVDPSSESATRTPVGIRTDDDDLALPRRPLALDAHEPLRQIEEEVVARVVERPRHDYPELDRLVDDRRLGDDALLIRRQCVHVSTLPTAPDERSQTGQRCNGQVLA